MVSQYLSSDELKQDPSIPHNAASEMKDLPEEAHVATHEQADKRAHGTGIHHPIRKSSRDDGVMTSIAETSIEVTSHSLEVKEPEDKLPDQLDRNK